ncbi:hypothetical protein ZWY2020_060130, partial [Hordeum vulgare]
MGHPRCHAPASLSQGRRPDLLALVRQPPPSQSTGLASNVALVEGESALATFGSGARRHRGSLSSTFLDIM